jgi:hypothetical protein
VTEHRAASRRAARRRPWPRRLLVTALVLLALVVGIAIGKALNDGPPTPNTETYVRTLTTLTDEVGTTTGP